MKAKANITQLRANLVEFVKLAESGQEVIVCRRNLPVARLIPMSMAVPTNSGKLSAISGWLEDDDPFFAQVLERRTRALPASSALTTFEG